MDAAGPAGPEHVGAQVLLDSAGPAALGANGEFLQRACLLLPRIKAINHVLTPHMGKQVLCWELTRWSHLTPPPC